MRAVDVLCLVPTWAEVSVPFARSSAALLRAAHPGPALAVTSVGAVLTVALDLDLGPAVLVVLALLTGQLSIGWSNDLVDVARDREVGRGDKPLATGEIPVTAARWACALALLATVPLSLACGMAAGVTNLGCVAAGWAYNVGLKSTPWSWLPFAVAFGGLPVFVSLAQQPPALPPTWGPLAGALLGVAAHLVNVLPDLDDDAATGVRGLPHRIGARWTAPAATAVLVLASVVIAVGAPSPGWLVSALALTAVALLAVLALLGRGRTPFRAAVGIAFVNVVMLAWPR